MIGAPGESPPDPWVAGIVNPHTTEHPLPGTMDFHVRSPRSHALRICLLWTPAVLSVGIAVLLWISLFFVQPRLNFSYNADQIHQGFGNIRSSGFYKPEFETNGAIYAWTREKAEITFDFSINKPLVATLEVRSAAAAGGVNAPVKILVGGVEAGRIRAAPDSRSFTPFRLLLPLPPDPTGKLQIALSCEPSVLPSDGRVVGVAIRSVELDQSPTWSWFTESRWLFWALPILASLAGTLLWVSWRRHLPAAGYVASLVCLAGAAFMGAAFLMFSELWLIDRSIYPFWQSAMTYLGALFAAAAIAVCAACMVKFDGREHIRRAILATRSASAPPEESLADFYRHRFIAVPAYAVSWALVLLWALPVTRPSGQRAWLSLAAVFFGVVLIPIMRQLRQGRDHQRARALSEAGKAHNHPEEKRGIIDRVPLWACLLTVFSMGLLFNLWINSFHTQWLFGDAALYDRVARSIVEKGFTPNPIKLLGYPVLISHLFGLFGDGYYRICFIVQQVITSLNGVIICALGHTITGRRSVALLGGLICALCPFTAAYSAVLLSEPVAVFLLTAFVYLLALIVRHPRVTAYHVMLGIALALLLEVRITFMTFMLVAAVSYLLIDLKWRVKLKCAFLFLLTFLLVHAPIVMANYTYYKQWVFGAKLSDPSFFMAIGTIQNHGHYFINPTSEAPEVASLLWKAYPEDRDYLAMYFSRHSWSFAKRVLSHLWDAWVQTYLYPYSFPLPGYLEYAPVTRTLNWLYLVFMVAGIWYILRFWRFATPIICAIGLLWVSLAVVSLEPRYMLPVYPLVTLLTAYGIMCVLRRGGYLRVGAYGTTDCATPRAAGIAWLVCPLVGVLMVVVLTPLVRSETYEGTFDRQLMYTDTLLKRSTLPPYFRDALPSLIEDLEAMRKLPEASIPVKSEKIDLCVAMAYLRLGDIAKAKMCLERILKENPSNADASRLLHETIAWPRGPGTAGSS